MAAPTAPLLNLSTLVDQPTIIIDDTPYNLLLPDALTLLDYKRLARVLPRLEELWLRAVASDLTAAEDAELGQAFREVCRLVLVAPAEVQAKLTDLHVIAIYQAFLKLPRVSLHRVGALMRSSQTPTAAPPPSTTSTGATSSRASRTRTPASARLRGSRKSRSASSAPIS